MGVSVNGTGTFESKSRVRLAKIADLEGAEANGKRHGKRSRDESLFTAKTNKTQKKGGGPCVGARASACEIKKGVEGGIESKVSK